jgi:hypothetical protein
VPGDSAFEVGDAEPVVPGPGLPPTFEPLRSNNNLDVVDHAGRRWFAWRTAPSHFASEAARLYLVSQDVDGGPWRGETTIRLGCDVREPRLVSWGGRLLLYFVSLGTTWWKFEPGTIHVTELEPDGWTDPEALPQRGYVMWRVRELAGELVMSVYRGADTTYGSEPEPTRVELWTSTEGRTWEPLDVDQPVVHVGGTETEVIESPAGGFVAVTRMEGPEGWGSDVCHLDDLRSRTWTSRRHAVKLDSPVLFRHGDGVYLVARRQVAFGGRYDLGWRRPSPPRRTMAYHLAYWVTPKRSALWRVGPDDLSLTHVADLPGRGDTSFAAVVPDGPDAVWVYDYSSPLAGRDVPWCVGQFGRTAIHRSRVTFGRG